MPPPDSDATGSGVPGQSEVPWVSRIQWGAVGSIATLAIGVAYLITYLHEYAYAQAFGIPRQLITLDTSTVVASAAVVFVYAVIMVSVTGPMIFWFLRAKSVRRGLLILSVVFVLVYAPVLFAFDETWLEALIPIPALLAWLGIPYVFRRITGRPPRRTEDVETFSDWAVHHVGFALATTALFIVYLSLLFYGWGNTEAHRRREFFTIRGSQEVVLAIYGKVAVTSTLARPGHIGSDLRVIHLDSPGVVLDRKVVGPLRRSP
jgi:hypothetical protein